MQVFRDDGRRYREQPWIEDGGKESDTGVSVAIDVAWVGVLEYIDEVEVYRVPDIEEEMLEELDCRAENS